MAVGRGDLGSGVEREGVTAGEVELDQTGLVQRLRGLDRPIAGQHCEKVLHHHCCSSEKSLGVW
ncbi:hypothetical protein RchiOBHm_Chr4g0440241 [Rosa chinensis]|uniref:Uncharacterized protein n=1 Tax=Rosa chinensis TaxID=74649 RepID=A0A2P6R322_ROSCH|nr:hypothetical protein RchiOBHm_Chr4g0440241 [Rosa chinensis]